jgi:prevent-host-death family protein
MPIVGLRQLSRETRDVIDQLQQDGEPVVITRHGKPIAALTAVTDEQAASVALAAVPEYVARREDAARAIAAGEGRPSSELLAEIEAEDAGLDLEEPASAQEASEAALAPGELEIPVALVEQLAGELGELPGAGDLAGSDEALDAYHAYVIAAFRASLPALIERVRAVSVNILESGEVSSRDYVTELQRAAEVETLAIPQRR